VHILGNNCRTRLLDGKKAINGLNGTQISVNKVSQVGDWVGGMGDANTFPDSVCLFPHTLPFFLNFWQALQILTSHIFFWPATYSTSDILLLMKSYYDLTFSRNFIC